MLQTNHWKLIDNSYDRLKARCPQKPFHGLLTEGMLGTTRDQLIAYRKGSQNMFFPQTRRV